MHRVRPIAALTAATTAGLTLSAVTAFAGAPSYAAQTCLGRPATIVGVAGQSLDGTDGADVIVTAGATSVDAEAGDDLICVTGATRGVRSGTGDDVVDATASEAPLEERSNLYTILGAGADTFTGGPGNDVVHTGPFDVEGEGVVDESVDVVDTGAGDDTVRSGGVADSAGPATDALRTATNHDRVTLGPGDDALVLGGTPASDAILMAGTGDDRAEMALHDAVSAWAIDLEAQTLGADATSVPFVGFTEVSLTGTTREVDVVGSAAAETVTVQLPHGSVGVRTGGGDDVVDLTSGAFGDAPIALDGGRGDDLIRVASKHSVTGDVSKHRVNADRALAIKGFEGIGATAPTVHLRGDGGRNTLEGEGCHVRLQGRGGADTLSSFGVDIPGCSSVVARLQGGPGNDRLGSDVSGTARLQGGAGRDALFLQKPGRGGRIVVDLAKGRYHLSLYREYGRGLLTSVEDADVTQSQIVLFGARRAERLHLTGCRVQVRAGGGDDTVDLDLFPDTDDDGESDCARATRPDLHRAYGGRGDDDLSGTAWNDTLIGGPGRDRAYGHQGRDTCVAEIVRRCER